MNYSSQFTLFLEGNCSSDKGGLDEFSLSLQAGKDIIKKAAKSTWFEWVGGSTFIFWQWKIWLKVARDGFPMFMTSPAKAVGKCVI